LPVERAETVGDVVVCLFYDKIYDIMKDDTIVAVVVLDRFRRKDKCRNLNDPPNKYMLKRCVKPKLHVGFRAWFCLDSD
jgi:hypothetical protein